jgi:hypothetical protein
VKYEMRSMVDGKRRADVGGNSKEQYIPTIPAQPGDLAAGDPSLTEPRAPESVLGEPMGEARVPRVDPVEPCCELIANSALKGRMGRIVIAFSEGVEGSGTQVAIFSGEKQLTSFIGAKEMDMLPGAYTVVVNNRRVEGVEVKAGHNTRLKLGVIRFNAGPGTAIAVFEKPADAKESKRLTSFLGSRDVVFPPGEYQIEVSGGRQAVKVEDGKIVEF